jgi:hypothetical protein
MIEAIILVCTIGGLISPDYQPFDPDNSQHLWRATHFECRSEVTRQKFMLTN